MRAAAPMVLSMIGILAGGMLHVANAEMPSLSLTIKDHKFDPATLEIPAGQKVKLLVKNLDPTPEEFESTQLNREKIVPAGSEVTVYVGPLEPGEYPFMGDFNQATAQGRLVVKSQSGR